MCIVWLLLGWKENLYPHWPWQDWTHMSYNIRYIYMYLFQICGTPLLWWAELAHHTAQAEMCHIAVFSAVRNRRWSLLHGY